jgi:hypothetical protein
MLASADGMGSEMVDANRGRNRAIWLVAIVLVLAVVVWKVAGGERAPQSSSSPQAASEVAARDQESGAVSDPSATLDDPHSSGRTSADATEDEAPRASSNEAPAKEPVVLSGVAVDEAGRPLSLVQLDWIVLPIQVAEDGQEIVAASGPRGSVNTNDAGRFELEIQRPRERKAAFYELTLNTESAQGRAKITCLDQPRCDVGLVSVAGPPVLVGGIVVDTTGKPIPGVFISMVDRAHAMGGDVARTGPLPKGQSGADGRFELRGHSRAHRLTVWFSSFQHAQEVREGLLVPVTDLRIVLTKSLAPFVRLRVQRGDLGCTEGIMAYVHHPKQDLQRLFMLQVEPDVWEAPGLIAGTCDVEITACGVSLAKLEGVDVPPSGPSLDPRLVNVDLRGRLECVAIEVVSEDGQPFPRGVVQGGRWAFQADDAGRIALARPIGSRILVKDCHGREVELSDGAKICAPQ